MKTKQEIREYKECIGLAKIQVIDFLMRTLNKGLYFTRDEITKKTDMEPLFVQLALDTLIIGQGYGIVKVSVYEDIDKPPVSYYGWN